MELPAYINLRVNHYHIASGKRLSIDSCPFALALNDLIRANARLYSVMHHEHIWKDMQGNLVCYYHPQEAQKFINDFDADKPVNPANFILVRK